MILLRNVRFAMILYMHWTYLLQNWLRRCRVDLDVETLRRRGGFAVAGFFVPDGLGLVFPRATWLEVAGSVGFFLAVLLAVDRYPVILRRNPIDSSDFGSTLSAIIYPDNVLSTFTRSLIIGLVGAT
jgi:hypothetical protein